MCGLRADLTNKDSIERSAPKMIGYNQDVIARSLDAMGAGRARGPPLPFAFMCLNPNGLRRMTVGPNPATEASMAKVGWTVQGAFFGRNSHSIRESGPTPCREAAQSNEQR